MLSKDALHQPVDRLPDAALGEAERYLRALQTEDPVLRAALLAPYDDEPEIEEERAGVREARAEIARGELVDDADLVASAGLPRILAEAPWDDEPETPEEASAVEQAYERVARGEIVSHEELRRELGW
jgi:hypothetical protein